MYEVIFKDENCETEVEKKTLKMPPSGRLGERESVGLDLVGCVKRRKRSLSKSTDQKVVQMVHGVKFESAQDLDQAGDRRKRKIKLFKSTEQKEVKVLNGAQEKFEPTQDSEQARYARNRLNKMSKSSNQEVLLVVHGENEKLKAAQDLDQAREEPLLTTCSINEKFFKSPDARQKMKIFQSDAVASKKVITPSPPGGRVKEMMVALWKEEEMMAKMRKELGKIQQRKRKIEEKERDCEEEMDEVKRELVSLHKKMR